jgi:hypothetical protein
LDERFWRKVHEAEKQLNVSRGVIALVALDMAIDVYAQMLYHLPNQENQTDG